jgi:hypothetical protein
LLYETVKRAEHFAEEIARLNSKALEQKNLDRVDSSFLDNEQDVASYELFDLEGRIVRPMGKLNEYISDTFSIRARDWALKNANKQTGAYKEKLDDGEIGVSQKIMAYSTRSGINEAVGVIAIRFTPRSLAVEATTNLKSYLEALVTSAICAILFYGIIYYLTLKPLEEIRIQTEESLRGKRRGLEGRYLWSELGPLKSTINSLIQRIRELSNDTSQAGDDVEDPGPYISRLKEFMMGAQGPAMILDAEKNLVQINPEAEDSTGIRQTGSEGMSLLDIAREQGFAATVIELCDNCANNAGGHQKGAYELQGHEHAINVVSLLGRDNFAKGFYITFKKS